jgi:hypothetical protein
MLLKVALNTINLNQLINLRYTTSRKIIQSGQTKDYEIGICCFSAKYAELRRKSKDWLARNQNNVSEWSDISTCGLLFQ